MATPHHSEPAPEWVEDDPEIELVMEMDDEELEFDEFSDEEDAVEEKAESPRDCVPLWRLIEMSQENRSLKLELADFDDYDDPYDGDPGDRLAH